jgi:heterodisulfide reductase subunit A-like polyferredoxin
MSKIGVFVCHCGNNIAGTVDVHSVVEEVLRHPDVCFAIDYKYMCSDPGQQLIKDSILEHDLDGVVVAACSPAMHETTFRRTVSGAGVNPYRCESANIREQVSWVHQKDPLSATSKATAIARSIVEKVRGNEELVPLTMSVNQRALIIGGGIAGMQTALDIADAGYPVILTLSEMKAWAVTWPCSLVLILISQLPLICFNKKIEQVENHPSDPGAERSTGDRAIWLCGQFQGPYELEFDDVNQEANPFNFDVGAIIVATGWQPYDLKRLPEYGCRNDHGRCRRFDLRANAGFGGAHPPPIRWENCQRDCFRPVCRFT